MQISNKDWLLLSAYLDGELSQREEQQLDIRLAENPELRSVLEGMKETKNLLRWTPRLKAPGDYRLREDQVKNRRGTRFPVYRLAATVLSILLVGVLVVDFSGLLGRSGVMDAAAPAFQESVPEAALEVMEAPAEESLEKSAPSESADEEQEMLEMEPQEEQPETNLEGESRTEEAGGEPSQDIVAEELSPTRTMIPSPESPPTEMPSPPPTLEQDLEQIPPPRPSRDKLVTPLRAVEIILGLGVLAFSAAAWLSSRKKS